MKGKEVSMHRRIFLIIILSSPELYLTLNGNSHNIAKP